MKAPDLSLVKADTWRIFRKAAVVALVLASLLMFGISLIGAVSAVDPGIVHRQAKAESTYHIGLAYLINGIVRVVRGDEVFANLLVTLTYLALPLGALVAVVELRLTVACGILGFVLAVLLLTSEGILLRGHGGDRALAVGTIFMLLSSCALISAGLVGEFKVPFASASPATAASENPEGDSSEALVPEESFSDETEIPSIALPAETLARNMSLRGQLTGTIFWSWLLAALLFLASLFTPVAIPHVRMFHDVNKGRRGLIKDDGRDYLAACVKSLLRGENATGNVFKCVGFLLIPLGLIGAVVNLRCSMACGTLALLFCFFLFASEGIFLAENREGDGVPAVGTIFLLLSSIALMCAGLFGERRRNVAEALASP